MKKRKSTAAQFTSFDRKQFLYLFSVLFLFGCGVAMLAIDVSRSLFLHAPDRINFVVYGPRPTFYSIGVREVGAYAITFYPDMKSSVPGGYGLYRIGALGKLAMLERDPEIFKKAFSSITSTFTDYYFYEAGGEVYYGGPDSVVGSEKPNVLKILTMKSNAGILDKMYIAILIARIQPGSLSDIKHLPYERLKDDTVLRKDNFLDKYIGLFYNKTYRDENVNVQIIYTDKNSYNTAELFSYLLNGNGILVGDISRSDTALRQCRIIESKKEFTETGKKLASFFECEHVAGETDVYDVIMILGDLEERWGIN